jgi:hypothetical protein
MENAVAMWPADQQRDDGGDLVAHVAGELVAMWPADQQRDDPERWDPMPAEFVVAMWPADQRDDLGRSRTRRPASTSQCGPLTNSGTTA